MKNYFSFILAASIFLCSCGNHSGSGVVGSINGDLSRMDRVEIKEQRTFELDSVIEKIEYVKLGNTGDVLIGKVTHLLFTPDRIVVGDAYMSKAIFVFDREGNPRAVINRLGRGPQEYQNIDDVFLTPDRQAIGIVDNSDEKLLYFDMDGNFLRGQSLPFSCHDIEWIDDRTMMLSTTGRAGQSPALESYPDKEDLLFFTDTTLQTVHGSAFINPFNVDIFHFQPLNMKRFDDRIYVSKAFGDTIYQVTKESIFPRYWIDMKAIGGEANFGKDMSDEKLREIISRSHFSNSYVVTDDYVFFRITKNGIMFPVLFNEHTKKVYNIGFDSRAALSVHLLLAEFSDANRFVVAVPAFQFQTFCPDEVPGVELRNEIKEGLSDEDNPVLLFYTLKDPDVD